MNTTLPGDKPYRALGDLYMSIADYSSYETISFEYTLYLDLLFRRTIYVEESAFFIADSPFLHYAATPRGHIHEAIFEGIIVPLTKDTEVGSFLEMAERYPHLRAENPAPRPETLAADMREQARKYDRMYAHKPSGVATRAISKAQSRYYNEDLRTILQAPLPTSLADTKHNELARQMWQKTQRFRTEWVEEIVAQSESLDFASAPKTDFNRRGAKLMGVAPYKDLRQLIEHAPTHEQGEAIVAFLRWVHEIFYYSRSRAVASATTYSLKPDHVTAPLLRSLGQPLQDQPEEPFEVDIYLPTLQALQEMRPGALLLLRESAQARNFFSAVRCWQLNEGCSDKSDLAAAIQDYSAVICAAVPQRDYSLLQRFIKFDKGTLQAMSDILTVGSAITTLAVPSEATTMLAAVSATISLASRALNLPAHKARNPMLRPTKALLYGNNTLDMDRLDNLISC